MVTITIRLGATPHCLTALRPQGCKPPSRRPIASRPGWVRSASGGVCSGEADCVANVLARLD